jgi:hypothetical protein
MMVSLLSARQSRRSAGWEADSYISREYPRPLLLLRLSCDDCDDVTVVVGVHEVDAEPLSYRVVGFGTAAL